MRINELTDVFKQHPSGSNRIDSIAGQTDQFCALGIRIPSEVAAVGLINSSDIEKEYKSIFEVTYFNPNVEKETKARDSFTFLTMMNNKSGNHIMKYIKDIVKSEMRKKLGCENESDQILVVVSKNRAKSLEILGKLRLAIADLIDSRNKVK